MHPDTQFDFAVRDDAGHTRAIVEARRSLGTDAEWAAQIRRNWMEHGLVPAIDVFILVLPDRIYMWHGPAPAGALPDVVVDAGPLFAPYFERVKTTPEQIHTAAFDMMVAWWLEDLASPTATIKRQTEIPPQLRDAIAGGRVISTAAE